MNITQGWRRHRRVQTLGTSRARRRRAPRTEHGASAAPRREPSTRAPEARQSARPSAASPPRALRLCLPPIFLSTLCLCAPPTRRAVHVGHMPVNYSKWDNIDDSDEDEAPPSKLAARSVSDMVPAGATELPSGAAKAFLDALCAAVFTSFSTEDGRTVCSAALRRALPGAASLDEELKQHVLACHFFLPSCLPPCAAKPHPLSVRVANC